MSHPSPAFQRRVRLDALTALRFAAAFGVALCHLVGLASLTGMSAHFLMFGQFGVDFFFVLSGFVLAWSWKPQRAVRRFYWLRLARIWPAHLAVVGLLVAWGARVAWRTEMQDIFLVQQWWPTQDYRFGVNGVTWTLSVEAFFYLVFPYLMPALDRLRNRTLTLMVVAAWLLAGALPVVVWKAFNYGTPWFTELNPFIRMPEFMVGMAVAIIIQRSSGHPAWLPRALKVFGLLVLLMLVVVFVQSQAGEWNMRRVPPWPFFMVLPWACLIAGLALSEVDGKGRCPAWLATLGEWSFALYLVHSSVVYKHLWPTVSGWPVLLSASTLIVTSVLTSGLLYTLVERPTERWLRGCGPQEGSALSPHRE